MTDRDYVENARRTLSTQEDVLGHMIIGISTEASELLDAYKKHRFYGRELDKQNLKEELGDICWYLYQLLDELDYNIEQAKIDNITKLRKRYPNKFEDVVNRDQEKELSHIDN